MKATYGALASAHLAFVATVISFQRGQRMASTLLAVSCAASLLLAWMQARAAKRDP